MKKMKHLIFFLLCIGVLDILVGSLFLPYSDILFANVRVLHPYYNHGFNAGTEGVVGFGSFNPIYHINSLGMKDRLVRKVVLKKSKHRILFIGDSFTEGIGYNYDSTFCGYLSAKIDGSRAEILNAAVASFSPKLYYLRLDYLLNHEHMEADDLYVFLDYSDVSDELFYQEFKPELPNFWNGITYGIQKFYRNHSLIYYGYSKVSIRNFMAQNDLDKRLEFLYWIKSGNSYNEETGNQFFKFKGKWINDEMISLPVTKKAISLAQSNLSSLFHLCEQHHIKVHLVIYPVSDQVNDGVAFDQIEPRNKRYESLWQNLAREKGVDFIDLFPLFASKDFNVALSNKKQYYISDDSHWNVAGHKRVADSLYCIINK